MDNESVKKSGTVRLVLKTVLHATYIAIHMLVNVKGAVMFLTLTEEQENEPNLYNLKYFGGAYGTIWNYLFQTVYLFLALTHDSLEWVDKHQSKMAGKLRYWRDITFCALVVPYTCFVFGMFWGLYAIDRELVFPKVFDEVIPWWFNQCVHSNILILMVAETILQPRRNPTNKKLEPTLVLGIAVLYAIVYYSIYFLTHRWLYNVFGIMTWWQVCLFQLLIFASSITFYWIQYPINRLIHGPEVEVEKNGEVGNGMENGGNTETKEVKEKAENGEVTGNGTFDKSWSLKYRNMRQENSKL